MCNLFSDTLKVEVTHPLAPLLVESYSFCTSGKQVFTPQVTASVQNINWYLTASDSIPVHQGLSYEVFINSSRSYFVEAVIDSCTSERTELQVIFGDCELKIPNIFTPNGDGINDLFLYRNAEGKKISTKIYNRWGALHTQFSGNGGWDGQNASEGVYYYLIIADGKEFKGEVTLVR